MDLLDLALESLSNNPLSIGVLIYSYLIYSLFFTEGKLKKIGDLKTIFKIGVIAIGMFMLSIPIAITLPYTLSLIMHASVPTTSFTLQEVLIFTLVFVGFPWFIKHEQVIQNKLGKKQTKKYQKKISGDGLSLAGWFSFLISLNVVIMLGVMLLLPFIYYSNVKFLFSNILGVVIFLFLLNGMMAIYNKLVIISLFPRKKKKFKFKPLIKPILTFISIFLLINVLFFISLPKVTPLSEKEESLYAYRENFSNQNLSIYRLYSEKYEFSKPKFIDYFVLDVTKLKFTENLQGKQLFRISSGMFSIHPYAIYNSNIGGISFIKDYSLLFNSSFNISKIENNTLNIEGAREYFSNRIKLNASDDSYTFCTTYLCNIHIKVINGENSSLLVSYPLIISGRINGAKPERCNITSITGVEDYLSQGKVNCTEPKNCNVAYGGATTNADIIGGNLNLLLNLRPNSEVDNYVLLVCSG